MFVCPKCHRSRRDNGKCTGTDLHRQVNVCEFCGRKAKVVDCRTARKIKPDFHPSFN